MNELCAIRKPAMERSAINYRTERRNIINTEGDTMVKGIGKWIFVADGKQWSWKKSLEREKEMMWHSHRSYKEGKPRLKRGKDESGDKMTNDDLMRKLKNMAEGTVILGYQSGGIVAIATVFGKPQRNGIDILIPVKKPFEQYLLQNQIVLDELRKLSGDDRFKKMNFSFCALSDDMYEKIKEKIIEKNPELKKLMAGLESGSAPSVITLEQKVKAEMEQTVDFEGKLPSYIKDTERKQLIKVRIGQGTFRDLLLKGDNKCRLCGLSKKDLLIASHIKPWAVSNNDERIDEENGLLLCPNHDVVVDRGLITFEDDGKIVVSSTLDADSTKKLGIDKGMSIPIRPGQKKYLEWHRTKVFKK